MNQHQLDTGKLASQRAALRRRIKGFYQKYNEADWESCYGHLDPRLRTAGKVDPVRYADSLEAFRNRYGAVDIWYLRANLYFDVKNNRQDRPFAYVYVFWQDEKKAFHVFRERWVYHSGHWYTRVVGLVTHKETE
jgi:hypothetical protein